MELYHRIDQIIVKMRPIFSREAPFQWFVLLLWGVLLSHQPAAVTSYLNALGIGERYYKQALHWFESQSFKVNELSRCWGHWLAEQAYVYRLRGHRVYVGDGIKVSKEGLKMPGVKSLHQESENMSKPDWIRGHYFHALGVIMGIEQAAFASLIAIKLDDGIDPVFGKTQQTLPEKMATLCVTHMPCGSYALLDAYFACSGVLTKFREQGLHLITRGRISMVARADFCRNPNVPQRGRPRKWGHKVKLQELFDLLDSFVEEAVWLYGHRLKVRYQSFNFYWDSPEQQLLFVLVQLPSDKRIILLSSDLSLTGKEVIEAYGKRFKIEVAFRSLVHLLGGFAYRFWLKLLTPIEKWPGSLRLSDYHPIERPQIQRKVEAFERFVMLNAIALGLLQVLALEMPKRIWDNFPRWFRTLPVHGYPSEQIVRITLQHQHAEILSKSRPSLLLDKLLAHKMSPQETSPRPPLTA